MSSDARARPQYSLRVVLLVLLSVSWSVVCALLSFCLLMPSSLPCVICTFSPNDPNKLVPFVYGAMRFGMFGLGSSALCSSVPRSSILRTAYLVSSCFSPFSNEITSIKFRAPYLGLTLDNEGIT